MYGEWWYQFWEGVRVLVSDDDNVLDDNEKRVSEEAATNGNDGMNFAPAPKLLLSPPTKLPVILWSSRGKIS